MPTKIDLAGQPLDLGAWPVLFIFLGNEVQVPEASRFSIEDGLFVGGTWDRGSNAGRWASWWNWVPADTHQIIGLRCAVPLSFDYRPESLT